MNERMTIILTLVFILTTLGFIYSPVFNQKERIIYKIKNDPGRNEGSTPRTFVLPATPAVAKQQEMKHELIKDKKEIQKCMVKLINHGYKDVGSFDDVFDFKTKLTIIQYQLDKAIKVTGEFDEKTKTKLDC